MGDQRDAQGWHQERELEMYRIHIQGHYPDVKDHSYTVAGPSDVPSPMIRLAVEECAAMGEIVRMGHLIVEPCNESC